MGRASRRKLGGSSRCRACYHGRMKTRFETAHLMGPVTNGLIAKVDPSTLTPYGNVGVSPFDTYVADWIKVQHPAVFSAARLIINTVAMMPALAWRGGIQAGTRLVREELEIAQPQPVIVTRPNPFETKRQTITKILTSLVFRGNAYLWLTAQDPNTGQPTVAMAVHPDEVQVTWNADRTAPVYRWRGQDMTIGVDFAHIYDVQLLDELTGTGPLQAGRRTLGAGLEMDKYANRFFIEDATPSGVLEVPGKLTYEQSLEVRKQWEGQHAATRRLGVTSGNVVFKPISMTPEQSQFIQTRDYNTGEIARLFNMPGEMMGWNTEGASLTYRNLQDLYTQFIRQCLQPSYIEPIEDVFTTYLLPRGQQLRFDFSALTRATARERFEAYAVAINAGIMTVNEARKAEELPPVPGGDEMRRNDAAGTANPGDAGGEQPRAQRSNSPSVPVR